MKFSQFNSVIPFHDQYAIFNSFSQKVIFMEPKLHALLHGVYGGMGPMD